MGKMQQLEERVSSLVRRDGVTGCAVASVAGQGDILFDSKFTSIERALLSTIISSLALIGEKLGEELDEHPLDYQLLAFGATSVLIVPGNEDLTLMVAFDRTGDRDGIIEASRQVAASVAALVRGPDGGD